MLLKQDSSLTFRKLLIWAEENQENYSEDYFENGIGSCYINYRWEPRLVFPRVDAIIKHSGLKAGQSVLDFGCAKGFYVKRFLELSYDAFGVDISQYAISKCFLELRERLFMLENFSLEHISDYHFDLVLAKDVLEHVPPFALKYVIKQLKRISRKLVVVIPCCQTNGRFINIKDEKDENHMIRLPLKEWKRLIGGRENRLLCKALKGKMEKGSLCLIYS